VDGVTRSQGCNTGSNPVGSANKSNSYDTINTAETASGKFRVSSMGIHGRPSVAAQWDWQFASGRSFWIVGHCSPLRFAHLCPARVREAQRRPTVVCELRDEIAQIVAVGGNQEISRWIGVATRGMLHCF
jgi:hypothetical protein